MSWKSISDRELRQLGATQNGPVASARTLRSRRSVLSAPRADSPALVERKPARWTSPEPESLIECLSSFTLFAKLPESIRKKIWITAIPSRVIPLFYELKSSSFITQEPNISLLSVCKEARETALEIVMPTFTTEDSSRIIYIDVEQDKIFLDPGRYGDLGRILLQWHAALIPQQFRKIERLDIGVYEDLKKSVMSCIETLGETFLLDQARSGMPFTQVRLIAHTPFRCNFDRHTSRLFTVDCKDQVEVHMEENLLSKVQELNKSMLEIARHYWGSERNDTYRTGVVGPVKLELHYGFCGLQGIKR